MDPSPSAHARNFKSIYDIKYLHLAAFTDEFNNTSVHVRKSEAWTLRQFYHILSLHGNAQNIAKNPPYREIEKAVTHFLNKHEYRRLICYFCLRATDLRGQRNLVVILLLRALAWGDLYLARRINQESVKKPLPKDANSGARMGKFTF